MNKTTTQKDLLLYAYNESGISDSDRIQRSIDGDPLIQQEFNELNEALFSMDKMLLNPSEKSMDVILSFAKNHQA